MKLNLKSTVLTALLSFFTLFSTNVIAQSSCCGSKKHDKATCTKNHKDDKKSASCIAASDTAKTTSGCSPSSCRGAKTKFGEAKIISNLRNNLIALKSEMEQSKKPVFETRSYDIHQIVGKSDDESLKIIARELNIIEKDFANKTQFMPLVFTLPENKAKQITYLDNRIEVLKKLL
ncbi:hypothetical protein [Aquimarina sp. Aq78]|uniref:hypothetical protein n=1 Tax=Aquimarina sp. Aq78 TaxID=1191889 RepID=UPI000D0E91AE|nr:hypothetical protein [Aquimarina sp. Aq78]